MCLCRLLYAICSKFSLLPLKITLELLQTLAYISLSIVNIFIYFVFQATQSQPIRSRRRATRPSPRSRPIADWPGQRLPYLHDTLHHWSRAHRCWPLHEARCLTLTSIFWLCDLGTLSVSLSRHLAFEEDMWHLFNSFHLRWLMRQLKFNQYGYNIDLDRVLWHCFANLTAFT